MPVHGATALERRPMRVSCVVSRHKEYDRLWFPSWKLRHGVAARGNVQDEATKFLAEYLPRLEPNALLTRRIEQAEELHTLTLELEPAPLAAFTGRHLGAEQLPAPIVREGEEEERAPKKERRIPTPRLQSAAVDLTERARQSELRRARARRERRPARATARVDRRRARPRGRAGVREDDGHPRARASPRQARRAQGRAAALVRRRDAPHREPRALLRLAQ